MSEVLALKKGDFIREYSYLTDAYKIVQVQSVRDEGLYVKLVIYNPSYGDDLIICSYTAHRQVVKLSYLEKILWGFVK